MAKVLVMGVDGQDGAYLARYLLAGGDDVSGTFLNKDAFLTNFSRLGISLKKSEPFALPGSYDSWELLLERHKPEEVYLLAGITSVGQSFALPVETIETAVVGVTMALEVIRRRFPEIKLFYAGSVECFGETSLDSPADEETPFRPTSPYGIGKAGAASMIRLYREAYGLNVCTGFLAPHESPLRPPTFVTRKIIDGAKAIAAGELDVLQLGNLDVWRDWGWAEEFVQAYVKMLRCEKHDDYIIATGETHSLREFVQHVFIYVGIPDWERKVVSNSDYCRPADIKRVYLNPSRSRTELCWEPQIRFHKVIEYLLR